MCCWWSGWVRIMRSDPGKDEEESSRKKQNQLLHYFFSWRTNKIVQKCCLKSNKSYNFFIKKTRTNLLATIHEIKIFCQIWSTVILHETLYISTTKRRSEQLLGKIRKKEYLHLKLHHYYFSLVKNLAIWVPVSQDARPDCLENREIFLEEALVECVVDDPTESASWDQTASSRIPVNWDTSSCLGSNTRPCFT